MKRLGYHTRLHRIRGVGRHVCLILSQDDSGVTWWFLIAKGCWLRTSWEEGLTAQVWSFRNTESHGGVSLLAQSCGVEGGLPVWHTEPKDSLLFWPDPEAEVFWVLSSPRDCRIRCLGRQKRADSWACASSQSCSLPCPSSNQTSPTRSSSSQPGNTLFPRSAVPFSGGA